MEWLSVCQCLCPSRALSLTLFATLLSYLASIADACTCGYTHPQKHYCHADFAIKAKVSTSRNLYKKFYTPHPIELPEAAEHIAYKIHINRIFKGEDALAKINSTDEIVTSVYGSLCGRVLSKDTKYLIIGHIAKGHMTVSHCDFVREWKQLSKRLKKSVAYNFDRNCECQVKSCYLKKCHKKRGNSTCQFEVKAPHAGCYEDHAYCQLSTKGKCKWSRTSVTVKCVQNSKRNRRAPSKKKVRKPYRALTP